MNKKLWILVKNELMLLVFSKLLIIFTSMFIILCIMNTWINVNLATNQVSSYLDTKNRYIQNGENIWEELKKPLNVIEKIETNGVKTIQADNPIKYELKKTIESLTTISGTHYTTSLLEVLTFLFGPILFPLFGYFYGNFDYRYGTVKIKSIQYKWSTCLFAKSLLLLFSSLLLVSVISIISVLFGNTLPNMILANQLNYEEKRLIFSGIYSITNPNIIMQISTSIFLIFTYLMIGFSLSIPSKKAWYPAVLLIIYNLFVPVLGKFDFKNVVSVIGHQTFSFNGYFKLFSPLEAIHPAIAYAYLTGLILIGYTVIMISSKHQSKYT